MKRKNAEAVSPSLFPDSIASREDWDELSKILLKAIETTEEMVVVTDAPEKIGNEKIVFINGAFEKVTGYSKDEVLGKAPSLLQGPETDGDVIARLVQRLEQGERFEGETFNYKKDGSRYRVRWSIDPIRNEEGDITHFVSVQRDVTMEFEQREKLEQLVSERETLVNETHHRVKNNLAAVAGLLQMQAMKSDLKEVQEVLSESMNRIQSIAAIHEKLYQTEGFTSIDLGQYIRDLLEHIQSTMSHLESASEVSFTFDLKDISVKTSQLVPFGLLLNELVTNAFKHAFDGEGGTVSISCAEENGHVTLEVRDNGKGLPEGLEIQQTNSLGLRLIDTLTSQLDAEYSLNSDDGTRFRMSFKKEVL